MEIGFIGLGNMGRGIADNLLKAGNRLTVFNRSPDKAAALVAAGGRHAASPREAAQGAEIVFTMLADDGAVEAMTLGPEGLQAGLAKDALHISASTISIALARKLQQGHAAAGQRFVSAPVFGRPEAAAGGKLFVVAAGEARDIARATPAFEAFSQKIFPIGAEPWMANLVKLSGNFLIAATIESLGEAIALVRKNGIDAASFVDLLTGSLFDAPVYRTYGRAIVEERYQPAGFKAPLGLKDIRSALAAGEASLTPLPLASLLRDHFLTLIARGDGELDWAALGKLAAENAGLG